MTYCKNYCEEEGISTSNLSEPQKTLYYIAENMKMEESISEEGYKHFQMAIKALEQESVLDKIRAEIESCREDEVPHLCDYRYHRNEGLDMALDIIDKYKAESEDKE